MSTRQEREVELLALLRHRSSTLDEQYRQTLGLASAAQIPPTKPPAIMIMEILDAEFPGFIDELSSGSGPLPPLTRKSAE